MLRNIPKIIPPELVKTMMEMGHSDVPVSYTHLIYTKDAGKVILDGKEVEFKSARDALDAGISMIHQELSPIPEMTVAENVFLGREQKKIKGLPFVDKKELNRKTQELLEEYNLEQFIRPSMKMKDLNIAQIQMMEIIKAVSYNSKVIIMDKPTSSLSEKETETLFEIIDSLRKKDVGIIYISHRMEEVFQLADRVSVLRDGQFIGCVKVKDASREQLINMMVGRELEGGYPVSYTHLLHIVRILYRILYGSQPDLLIKCHMN